MKVDRRLVILSACSVIVLITGTLAFFDHNPEQGWMTALYKAVQLFSINSGVVEGATTPPLLEIARWLALGTLIALVYTAGQALLGVIVFFLQIDTLNRKNSNSDRHLQSRLSRTSCAFGAN
jgi:uncharacterized membrane protein